MKERMSRRNRNFLLQFVNVTRNTYKFTPYVKRILFSDKFQTRVIATKSNARFIANCYYNLHIYHVEFGIGKYSFLCPTQQKMKYDSGIFEKGYLRRSVFP